MATIASKPLTVTSYVSGVGMSVPDRVVPNAHFETYLDTNDEWIRTRTGIRERRWSDRSTGVSALAAPAATQAIASAGLATSDIDAILFATVTPDYQFPSAACMLQERLGMASAFAMDLNAVCSGFVYGLTMADSLIASGKCDHVLVVGADVVSRLADPQDRTTCVLFGDGAGAIVLSRVPKEGDNDSGPAGEPNAAFTRGIYDTRLHSDGTGGQHLCVPVGSANEMTPESMLKQEHFLTMSGRDVFKHAVRSMTEVSKTLLRETNTPIEDIDWFIVHQANQRILSAVGEQLGIPEDKVPINLDRYGNTSAASIPILLAECVADGRLKPGDLVLLSAFGGGFTWGGVLLRW